MSQIVIRVEGLGKRYRIGEGARHTALRDLIGDVLRAPGRILTGSTDGSNNVLTDDLNHRPKKSLNEAPDIGGPIGGASMGANGRGSRFIWALKDISFEVRQGEVVGLIGRNGAGKSTLLKILARITRPTEGHAEIHGRVGSLLEVGTGFHPELTGRENVYMSGAILGMRKAEIDRKFDEIVAFSEVERFLQTPLKHYSSGMQMRLAFAVAAHLEPEILLVDEVLAVGDVAFQKKCLGKMDDISKQGRTIILVSHNLGAISQLCQRTIWIDKGTIAVDGQSDDTAAQYMNSLSKGHDGQAWERTGSGRARFTSVEILDSDGNPCTYVPMGSDIRIRTAGGTQGAVMEFTLAVQLVTTSGTVAVWAYDQLKTLRSNSNAEFLVDLRLPQTMLMPGLYFVHVWIGRAGQEEFDYVKNAARIEIIQGNRIPVTATVFNHLGLVYVPIEATQIR
jgi:lipopolysaccharide transport system ATP-binding protein